MILMDETKKNKVTYPCCNRLVYNEIFKIRQIDERNRWVRLKLWVKILGKKLLALQEVSSKSSIVSYFNQNFGRWGHYHTQNKYNTYWHYCSVYL